MALTWEQHQQNIFKGESGGDYDALFGYQNRPNGAFAGIKVSEMPVGDVIRFTSPTGKYGQYVKGQVGRVATPVGAYQVVGTTLRDAVKALGIDPEQKFDKATQDKIGQYILKTQGTGAWEGYGKGGASMQNKPAQMAQPQQPQKSQGLIGGALGLSADFADKLKMGLLLGSDPRAFAPMVQAIQAGGQERRARKDAQAKANVTASYLETMGKSDLAKLVRDGGMSGAEAIKVATSGGKEFKDIERYKLAQSQGYEGTYLEFEADLAKIEQTGKAPAGLEAMNKKFGEEYLDIDLVGLGEARNRAAKIKTVLDKLEAGEQLTGPLLGLAGEFGRSVFAPESQQAKDLVESVVQTSLREILGGQFAQQEGKELIKRSYNINLPPEQNAARLRALFAQLDAAAEAKAGMAQYFKENNFSLAGYEGSRYTPSRADLEAAMDAAVADTAKPEPTTKPVVINGYTIEKM
jgi:hypothetical protein|tara:strand:- start:16182 stop:17573 length:1392 start_codon:yes stop_codon:yes gene_type:complete